MEGMKLNGVVHLLVVSLVLGLWMGGVYCQGDDDDDAAIYIVRLKQAPAVHHQDELKRLGSSGIRNGASQTFNKLNKPRGNTSRADTSYGSYLVRFQNSLLRRVSWGENYLKLYSYQYLINGFAVLITSQQESIQRTRAFLMTILSVLILFHPISLVFVKLQRNFHLVLAIISLVELDILQLLL